MEGGEKFHPKEFHKAKEKNGFKSWEAQMMQNNHFKSDETGTSVYCRDNRHYEVSTVSLHSSFWDTDFVWIMILIFETTMKLRALVYTD